MTSQTQDPVAQIQEVEESSKQQIEKASTKFDEQLNEFKDELVKKTKEFEENLKTRGLEKLDTVKKEAGELFKSQMSTAESERNRLVSDAEGKEKEAVAEIVSVFTEHIKK